MLLAKPTAEDIRKYRDDNAVGLIEAKSDLAAEWRKANLSKMRTAAGELYTVEACRDVIVDLLDLIIQIENES